MRRIWSGIVVAAMVVLGLGGPALAQEANSSEATGSVLVFAKFLRGTVTVGKTSAGAPILEPRSSFNISVTCPPGGTCAEGAKVKLLARWVCPATQDFRDKFICKATNFELITTMKGTVTFNPESVGTRTAGLLIPKPPCEKGYLIVWVVSPADASALSAIKFDALAGNAVLRNGNSSANAYTAVPIQAVSSLATGDRTDVNHDGRLAFDGQTEYKALTGRLAGPVRYSRSAKVPGTNLGRIDTVLTLLTLDTLVQRSNFPTFVDYHFFNEAEALISTSHEFICWTEVKLTDIDSNLDEFFGTGGHNGLFETTEAEKIGFAFGTDTAGPVTLLGIAETSERNAGGAIIREYAYSLVNGGTLVPTIFAP